MKIAAFQGSPRKNGNTSLLLQKFIKGAEDAGNLFLGNNFLQDMIIAGCRGCGYCRSNDGCVIKDDMGDLLSQVKEADVLVLATPVYWWSMTGQIKVFIDRLYALPEGTLKGKEMYFIMSYGGALPNSGPELVEKTISAICAYTGIKLMKVFGVCTDEYMPASQNETALKEIYSIGFSIKK